MIKKYLKYLKNNNYSINTIKTYKSILEIYCSDLDDLRKIKTRLRGYFSSPATARLHYSVISSYMKWNKDKRVDKLKQIKIPPISYKYFDVFNYKYLELKTRILNDDSENIIIKKMIIKFLFETGIRAEELKNIIEIKKDTIIILGKGNKKREIFYKKNTFDKMGFPFLYSTKTLRLWVKEILGCEFTPHSIRRSFATHLLKNGANAKFVMLQMGHEKIETTFRYLHLNLKENQKEYNKFFK